MLMHAIAHGNWHSTNTVREYALKADSEKKKKTLAEQVNWTHVRGIPILATSSFHSRVENSAGNYS